MLQMFLREAANLVLSCYKNMLTFFSSKCHACGFTMIMGISCIHIFFLFHWCFHNVVMLFSFFWLTRKCCNDDTVTQSFCYKISSEVSLDFFHLFSTVVYPTLLHWSICGIKEEAGVSFYGGGGSRGIIPRRTPTLSFRNSLRKKFFCSTLMQIVVACTPSVLK
jgi:hypothetical protein